MFWKNLEGFVMLGKDESLLYDDEFLLFVFGISILFKAKSL